MGKRFSKRRNLRAHARRWQKEGVQQKDKKRGSVETGSKGANACVKMRQGTRQSDCSTCCCTVGTQRGFASWCLVGGQIRVCSQSSAITDRRQIDRRVGENCARACTCTCKQMLRQTVCDFLFFQLLLLLRSLPRALRCRSQQQTDVKEKKNKPATNQQKSTSESTPSKQTNKATN